MRSRRCLFAILACAPLVAGAGPGSITAFESHEAPPTVTSIGSFGRSVANLERSIAFYRDVMGMEMVEARIPEPAADPQMQALTHTPGARSRTVHMRVAYTPANVALTEFSGIDQRPMQGSPGQPGIPWLTLNLKDDASFAGIERAHPPTFSLFEGPPPPGAAAPPSAPPAGMKRTGFGAVRKMAFVRDADGFLVEVLHRDPKSWFTVVNPLILAEEGGESIPGPPVVGLQFVIWERSEHAMRFYHDLLGFDIRPGYTRSLQELFSITDKLPEGDCAPDRMGPSMANMADPRPVNGCWAPMPGPPGMTAKGPRERGVTGNCAGVRCEWFERDPPGKPFQPRIQDPGAGYLSLWVGDLDGVLKNMKAAGVEVVTSGGHAVQFKESRRVMVRDFSSGFYVILMEKNHDR